MTNYSLKGTDFARAVMCLTAAKGIPAQAQAYAESKLGLTSRVCAFLEKAAVGGAYTGDSSGWAEDIAEAAGREFIGVVNERSILGRLGCRPAPLNVRLVGVGTSATAYWCGESKPIPATQLAFNGGALQSLFLSAVAAGSKEVFSKVGDPKSEAWVRAELLRAAVQTVDDALMDPANSGITDVRPASLLSGVSPIDASGVTDVVFLLKAIINDFPGDLETASWVARPETFVALHDLTRPNIGARGGELLGLPAIASRYIPQPVGGEILALIDGQGIALGDDGVEVSTTEQASLEMLDASLQQDGTSGAGAQMFSLFQTGCVAVKIDRRVNWNAVRPSVSYIENLELHDTSA